MAKKKQVSRANSEVRTVEPTTADGITFTKKVDPTEPVSLLGDQVRSQIQQIRKKEAGDTEFTIHEKERATRTIGLHITRYIDGGEVARMTKELDKADAFIEKVLKKKNKKIEELEKAIDLTKKARSLKVNITKAKRKRYLEIMSEIRDMGSDDPFPTLSGSNKGGVRLLNESQRFFPTDWLKKMHSMPLKVTERKRGVFVPGKLIAISSKEQAKQKSTMVHEMMHLAESTVPGMSDVIGAQYQRRTKGERLKRITNHGPGEFCRRDKWLGNSENGDGEYMGKYYKGGEHHEIATMAMEGILFDEYPIEDDPEVREMVLGLIAST